MSAAGGYKQDTGKLRYDLIPPEALEAIAGVYTYGATKYDDRNWERGLRYSRVYAALMRHLEAWRQGLDQDPEGFLNLAAVAWNAIALLTFELRHATGALDDLRQKET